MIHIIKYIAIALLGSPLLMACDNDDIDKESNKGENPAGDMVLFTSGSESMTTTRANIIAMPLGIRFNADMYSQSSQDVYDFNDPENAYLVVANAVDGSCLYRLSTFVTPADENNNGQADDHDENGHIFYWKSRNMHAFVGYIDDYNQASQNKDTYIPKVISHTDEEEGGNPSQEQIITDPTDKENSEKFTYLRYYEIDITKKDGMTSMSDQIDPLIAATEQIPRGSASEANRVTLVFRHQLAQVQVCIKGHESMGDFSASQIEKVQLYGISERVRIYPFLANKQGKRVYFQNTLPAASGQLIHPATAIPINLKDDKYATQPEGNEGNIWGSSMELYNEGTPTDGYLCSYQAITFGTVEAINIQWRETAPEDQVGKLHNTTFQINDEDFQILQSGKRYVYNLELRRGTLAVIKAVIDDWLPYETVYSGEGSIKH